MASKRKSKKVDTREEIMEKRAYESMELALAAHQNDEISTDEEELETAETVEASETAETSNAPEDTAALSTQEEAQEVSLPKEVSSAEEVETVQEAETLEELKEAEKATEPDNESDENAVMVAPPSSDPSNEQETEGLPEKTAHDPTSHVVEEDEEVVGGEVLWFFLAMLGIAVLMLLFGN